MSFTNNLGEFYEVYFDYLNYTGFSTQITGDDDCVTIRATTGDEDKFANILGQECLINIFIDENSLLTIDDFTATVSNNIKITVFKDQDYTNFTFQGFVAIDKMSQPFMDPPYIISIRALDGLGLLKGQDLVDLNGSKFFGNYSIITWIGQVLYKTNQSLPIRVYFDWYNTTFNQQIGVFEQTYLNSTTFSQGDSFINNASTDPSVDPAALTADDCYTCLEKIIRCFRCKLFQQNGAWHIVNLYSYANPVGYTYTEYDFQDISSIPPFDPTVTYTANQQVVFNNQYYTSIAGSSPHTFNPLEWSLNGVVNMNAVAIKVNQDYGLNIGKKERVFPIEGDQVLYVNQPLKWIQLTYEYDQSQNKVCNQDFSEGNRNNTYDQIISSQIIDPTITPVVNLKTIGYDAYCWQHFNGVVSNSIVPNPIPSSSPDKRAYIREVHDLLDYTLDRFLVIENSSLPTYMLAQSFLIDINDALVITLNIRTKNSHTGGLGYTWAWAFLYGDDGSHWALNCIEGPGVNTPEANKATWQQVDSNFRNSFGTTPSIGYLGGNFTNANTWTNVTCGQYAPALTPTQGRVEFYLINYSGYNDEIWYKNLSIQLTPYLLGSYTEVKGDYNYTTSDNSLSITQSEDDTVEISDSPKRYFKGALVDINTNLLPPGRNIQGGWYLNQGVVPSVFYRFTGIMNLLLYNNQYRVYKEIEGTFKGLIFTSDQDLTSNLSSGFLNSYYFVDTKYPTKRFMCTSYTRHLTTGEWTGVFIEVTNDVNDNGFFVPTGYPIFNYNF